MLVVQITMYATVHEISFPQEDESSPSEDELKVATQKFLECKNVKWGDLYRNTAVVGERNSNMGIYDGQKVIDLSAWPDDYGCLPQQFKILVPHPTENFIIPPRYWVDIPDNDYFEPHKDGLCHNSIVWFDHAPHRKELLSNITVGDFEGKILVYTFFSVQDKTYFIVYDDEGAMTLDEGEKLPADYYTSLQEEFKERLESDDLIEYNCLSTEFVVDSDVLRRTFFMRTEDSDPAWEANAEKRDAEAE